MACIVNTGYSLGCKDNLGGIQKVYARNWSASTAYTYDSNGQITGGTNTSTSWYVFEQRNETGEFIQEGQHSVENGTNFWNQNVNLAFHKYQYSIRTLLYTVAQAEVELIVYDQNGNYFLVGEQNGANIVASTANAGKAFGDMNGSTISLQAKEPSPARQLTSTFIGTLTFV